MKYKKNHIFDFLSLWKFISAKSQQKIFFLLALIIIVSVGEMVSIGSIIPLVTAISDPERVQNLYFIDALFGIKGIYGDHNYAITFAFIFLLCMVILTALRLLLVWFSNLLIFNIGFEISSEVFRRTIYQPYETHLNRNSSEIISGIVNKIHEVIYNVVMPVIALMSSIIIILAIIILLLLVNYQITIIVFITFSLAYLIIIIYTKNILLTNSFLISSGQTELIKNLQEVLGGIREILLNRTQDLFCRTYRELDSSLRKAQGSNQISSQFPRHIIELIGVALIILSAIFLSKASETSMSVISLLGVMALASQRLLPLSQQSYVAWTNLRGAKSSLEDILKLLNQPLPKDVYRENSNIKFEEKIELKDIDFTYHNNTSPAFKSLNLLIMKGDRIGIVGPTGCGKSTLVDIVMGLLPPTGGVVLIDGVPLDQGNRFSWGRLISHVPQHIYLADTTIAENIAFGSYINEINFDLVKESSRVAQIDSLIEGLPMQYMSTIGEGGIRLSGGQRQRLGIARALYKRAKVIIFDEATSALDGETEKLLIESIEKLGDEHTVIMIAHRISTLKACNKILKFDENGSYKVFNYQDLNNST